MLVYAFAAKGFARGLKTILERCVKVLTVLLIGFALFVDFIG